MADARAKRLGYANRGRGLEELLAEQHRLYRAQGRARIDKVPTPWVPTWREGAVRGAHVAEQALADFVGVLAGGRAVAVEAKSTRLSRLPFTAFRSAQIAYLDECLALGALCGVVLLWGARGELWAMPWRAVRDAMAGERRSLPWVPESPYRCQGLDYLAVMMERS